MCGIAGIIRFNQETPNFTELEAMNASMVHRGPDGGDVLVVGNVGLAHRRLSIIDPAGGAQPFSDTDSGISLTYNGEIYNYVELRDELKSDFTFLTDSDTEVLLRSYQKWGIECLARFRGMFAFALHDSRKNRLYVVRDRIGIKPLYFHSSPTAFAFASELLPLTKLPWIGLEVDDEALVQFFRYQYVPTPLSIYKSIRKLEPATYLELDLTSGKVEKTRYWDLSDHVLEGLSEDQWLDRLNKTLDEILHIYVRSDVDFGAFLSGGIDSSLVTALMKPQLKDPVRTFSIGFPEKEHSELEYAKQASTALGTLHHERIVHAKATPQIFSLLAKSFGEPFADSSAIPTYYVSKEAASQVKMVLSGDGGDELFGGYDSYRHSFADWKHPVRGRELYRIFAKLCPIPRLKRAAEFRSLTAWQRYMREREVFDARSLKKLFLRTIPGPNSEPRSERRDPVSISQLNDLQTYLVDDVLTKVDRMSMANSLEVRVPLLDHKLVELAFSMPLEMKIRPDGQGAPLTKFILKKSAQRFFTRKFLDRPKRGFGIPIVEWCRGELRPFILDRLQNPSNPIFNWVSYPFVNELVQGFMFGQDDLVAKVWALISFDQWIENVNVTTRKSQ